MAYGIQWYVVYGIGCGVWPCGDLAARPCALCSLCCAGKLLTGNTEYRLALRAAATKSDSRSLRTYTSGNIKFYIIKACQACLESCCLLFRPGIQWCV
jgi:hypothetical protein